MNKTNNVRLLNGSQSASSLVLLSRQLIFEGGTQGSAITPQQMLLMNALKRLMDAIHQYLDDFIGYLTGDLQDLPENLDQELIQLMSGAFYNLREPTLLSSLYEQYRLFAVSLIPAFQNVSLQVTTCKLMENQLDQALKKAEILDDINKLKEYIANLKKSVDIIPKQDVGVKKATIKEPYNTYIKMFGFPAGMIWEPDKLGFVEQYLNIKSL